MRGAEGATTAARMGRDGRPQGEAETDDRDWRRDGGRAGADGRRCAATAEEGVAADPRRADEEEVRSGQSGHGRDGPRRCRGRRGVGEDGDDGPPRI